MTKKQIKKLAQESYTKNSLDSKKVTNIVKTFKRSELKEYIKYLKNIENEKRVTLVTPKLSSGRKLISKVKEVFPDKKIVIKEDKSLIAGIRIVNKDTIYDFNIKNTLENLVKHITYGN